MTWTVPRMDTDLLHVLCALASLAVPLGIAWLMLGRDIKPKYKNKSHNPADPGGPKR